MTKFKKRGVGGRLASRLLCLVAQEHKLEKRESLSVWACLDALETAATEGGAPFFPTFGALLLFHLSTILSAQKKDTRSLEKKMPGRGEVNSCLAQSCLTARTTQHADNTHGCTHHTEGIIHGVNSPKRTKDKRASTSEVRPRQVLERDVACF